MSVIPFQPIGPVVVVIPHPTAPAQSGAIVLADVYPDVETSGTVVAIGSAFCCAACEAERAAPVQIGDRVLFGRGAGSQIDGAPFGLIGESFLLMQESEILAVLTDDAVCEVV